MHKRRGNGQGPLPPWLRLSRRSGRIPALPYSGSEGEMLRKRVFHSRRGRELWKSSPCLAAHDAVATAKGAHTAVTNRVARHPMSEDRAPNGGVHFASKTNSQMSSLFERLSIRPSRKQSPFP